MTWAVVAGLSAIAFMFAEPWLRRFLDARPRSSTERFRSRELDNRPPVRGELLRPGRELDRGDRW